MILSAFIILIFILASCILLGTFLVSKEKIAALNNPCSTLQDTFKECVVTLKKVAVGILIGAMFGIFLSAEIFGEGTVQISVLSLSAIGAGVILCSEKSRVKKIKKDGEIFRRKVANNWEKLEKAYAEASDPQYGDFSQLEMQQLIELSHVYEDCKKQIEAGVVRTDIIPQLKETAKGLNYLNGRRMMRYSSNEYEHKKNRHRQKAYKQDRSEDAENISSSETSQENDFSFFTGCNTPEEIKSRYRNLCRVYHPDTGSGDKEIFRKITEQYEKLIRK